MVEIRKLGTRGQTLVQMDPRIIKVMPSLNARDMSSEATREHVANLAESIRAQGFLGSHPLEIFQERGEVYVAAGHCRLAAVMSLIGEGVDIASIPTLNEDRYTSPEQRLINQVTSNSGLRLNLAEEGKVYAKLVAMGHVISKIAKDVGRSEVHVRRALDFQAAPVEARNLVSDGKVSATLAAEVVREEGGEKAVETLKAAVKTAEAAGKTKATKKHVEPRAPKPKKAEPAVSFEQPEKYFVAAEAGDCVAMVKRIAACEPSSDDSADAFAFARLIEEARAIFAPSMSQAAE